jgi:hypothetical protein
VRSHCRISFTASWKAAKDSVLEPTGQSIAPPTCGSRLASLNHTRPRTREKPSKPSAIPRIQSLLLPPASVEATSASRKGLELSFAKAQYAGRKMEEKPSQPRAERLPQL